MQQHIILDKLSEFLMVEECGFHLYQVVAGRTQTPRLKTKYQEFGRETAHHREVLTKLITQLGGDPNYISPSARVAEFKAAKLLESSLAVDGLSQEEIEASDLENVLLAETKDHADWHVLSQMAEQASGKMKEALQAAVEEVESQEDEHFTWARETLTEMTLSMANESKAPSPERWQSCITGPEPPITSFHPAPFEKDLLEGSKEPVWLESVTAREMAQSR